MNRFFKLSKGIHKYIGLVLILFLMWMSVSGIYDWLYLKVLRKTGQGRTNAPDDNSFKI